MMNLIEAISLGTIQGLTEFLPISSSGHLFLAEKWLGLSENLSLEILLHFGSLIAIIGYYWDDIFVLLKNFFSDVKSRDFIYKLIVATLLTVPGALLIKKIWDPELTFNLVGITLIATACFIFIAEKFRKTSHQKLNWPIVFGLGLIQSIAVLPGISRSGITIAFLILLGIDRKSAVKTSFFLAIPTIIGAMVFAIQDAGLDIFTSGENIEGFLAAIVASLISIKLMTNLVQKNWIWFVPYCALLGVSLLFI